ncbi:polyprenyl synthetase family protein [Streptomyces lavendulae]|uniref:polyprenyl synthetase family protein n=1 Tax=Streptomyces lavendulae TaxID=1914 RepID=UPI0024A29052|nr:polyprenyl synthetase family protein [Streptomyces lavendulae]GLW04527.1 geranylgeranyl pyrophosphate synthase [Streptomyces lavendulae subsp. lavendulae]
MTVPTSVPDTRQAHDPTAVAPPGIPDPLLVRHQIAAVLSAFVDHKSVSAREQGLPCEPLRAVGEFLAAGGKRIRPLFCVLGWYAAQGTGSSAPVIRVGAALEMFHAFALIHDDVMDHSDTRRGQPTLHRALTVQHCHGRTPEAAGDIGAGAAILVGDLALIWSDELLRGDDTGLDQAQRERVMPLIDIMRTEVMYGQYLDLTATRQPTTDINRALAIIRYKTAKYTIERPLHIGAVLAGANDQFLERLSAFALPLGDAFQLRDDLLGVFGHPGQTGKSVLDDLREGKHTVLITLALQAADPSQARLLRTLYGSHHLDQESAATLRAILQATGADQAVEHMIHERHEQALDALDAADLPTGVHDQLLDLAEQVVRRTS